MQKLYPIASKETRHLFIDPLLSLPTFISGEGYVSGETTSFIKPGKVPNLALLCQPEGVKFTVTEEPDPNTMAVTELKVGLYDDQGEWCVVTIPDLNVLFEQDGPSRATIKGGITVPHLFKTGSTINIPIDLLYERSTRALTFKEHPTAGYDSGIPQVLGIKLNLDWRDAKVV